MGKAVSGGQDQACGVSIDSFTAAGVGDGTKWLASRPLPVNFAVWGTLAANGFWTAESTTIKTPVVTNIVVGQGVSGTGIAVGSRVTVISGETVTLSKATTGAGTGAVDTAATWTDAQADIEVDDATGIAVGQGVTGTGIAAGSLVTVIDGTTITLDTNVTAAGTSEDVTFHTPVALVFHQAAFVGTAILEKSYDGGNCWLPCYFPNGTTAVSLTAIGSVILDEEPEDGCLYRARCSAFTSGVINTRVSQGR